MNSAIKVCLSKFFDINGRASRSEFWYFYLFAILFNFVVSAVLGVSQASIAQFLSVAILIPVLTAAIRRAHDHGRRGWFILIPFYSFYLLITAGDLGENRFGPPAIKY